jgi:hypothetical protein
MTSYRVSIVSLGIMYVFPVCVAPCFLFVPLSRLMCVVMVTYAVCLESGWASWSMYLSHAVGICFVLFVVDLGSFLCYRFGGRVRVVRSVDMTSSRL